MIYGVVWFEFDSFILVFLCKFDVLLVFEKKSLIFQREKFSKFVLMKYLVIL